MSDETKPGLPTGKTALDLLPDPLPDDFLELDRTVRAHECGRLNERIDVVTWLRDVMKDELLASAIERGEHRKERRHGD